jgi:thioredoxin 1
MSYKKLSSIGKKITEKYEILVPEIRSKEHKKEFVNKHKVCVIDVFADWCGPCKIVEPEFKRLFKEYHIEGVCGIAKEDVEKGLSPNVHVVPSFMFYVDGNFEGLLTGADISLIERKLNEILNAVYNGNVPSKEKEQTQASDEKKPENTENPMN